MNVYVRASPWLLAPGASPTYGTSSPPSPAPGGQRPLGRSCLNCFGTGPVRLHLPEAPAAPSGPMGTHTSVTPVLEVRWRSPRLKVPATAVARPQLAQQRKRRALGERRGVHRRAPITWPSSCLRFQPLLLQELRRKRAHSTASFLPAY